jgi:hypothetical protein
MIPGTPVMSMSDAQALARQATDELVEALTTGKAFDFNTLGWRLARGAEQVEVTSRPQIMFRGERLVIGSRTAKYFGLIDIRVGNRSQLANSTALPGTAFLAATPKPVQLKLDTAIVAMDVTLVVVNNSRRARVFEAMLIGAAAE